MRDNSNRIILLGGGGFIGKSLIEYFTQNKIQFLSLTSRDLNLLAPGAKDKLAAELQENDTLIILTSIAPDKGLNEIDAFIQNINMIEVVKQSLLSKANANSCACAHVVYISSEAVYSEQPNVAQTNYSEQPNLAQPNLAQTNYSEQPNLAQANSNCNITENTIPGPSTLYGMMHLVREKILQEACKQIREMNLSRVSDRASDRASDRESVQASNQSSDPISLTILRLTQTYGILDTHNAYGPCRFLRSALKDNKITLFGEGEEMRDHINIEDAVRTIVKTCDLKYNGILNLATGCSVSFGHLVGIIKSIIPKIEINFLPRQRAITHRHFDVSKLKTIVPEFDAVPIDTGIQKMYDNLLKLQLC